MQEFCSSRSQPHARMIIKKIDIWVFRRLEVRGDVVCLCNIVQSYFQAQCLSVAIFSVQVSTTSSRHLMYASTFNLKSRGKMNGRIRSPLLVITPNSMMWTGCLIFINMNMNVFSD